jgi:hypothetical protein
MGHLQQRSVAHHSYGLPPSLAGLCPILSSNLQRVIENELRQLKAYAVLALIQPVLSLIP